MEPITAPNLVNTQKATRREWIGLAILSLPTLLVSMDMSVVYLALPELSKALHPSGSQLLWITDIYGFMEAGLLITMGTLGDKIGRRRLLLIGAVAFAVASTGAAFAPTASLLIIARGLLGVAGATLLPSTLSIIRNMFHDPVQRTTAIGSFTTCFSAGTMLGPLAGGFLLHHFWWGSIFLMGVPVMVLLLVLAPALLPEYLHEGSGRFDLASALLSIIATLLVIYGIKHMAEQGIGWLSIICIITGTIVAALFLRRQKTQSNSLIDITLFRNPAFNMALLAFMFVMFSWAGIYLFAGQYLQLVLGMNPLQAGLYTIPGSAASIVSCMMAPRLLQWFRRGYVMAAGMLLLGIGIALFIVINQNNLPLLILATILFCGCGITVTLSTDMIIATAPPEKAGAAAGISETSATFGASLGIALLGSLYTIIYRSSITHNIPAGLSTPDAENARSTLGGALTVARQLPQPAAGVFITNARAAFVHALNSTAGVCVIVTISMAVMVAFRLGRTRVTAD